MGRWEDITKGIDPDTGQEVSVGVNADNHGVIILNKVYDPDLLDWVNMEQPLITLNVDGDLTVTMSDVEALLAGNYWKAIRMDWQNKDMIYRGYNTTFNASVSSATWYITKHTWVSKEPTYIQGPVVGAWDNRTNLGW